MFVKKLVERASNSKKPGGNSEGLKSCDVDVRLKFHYGIPSGANMFAYDSIQKILAISTRDGRIKLYGKDNTQVLLECPEAVPSKFLQFIQNKGFLLNANSNNHIEVWNVEKKSLSHVHSFKEEITTFTVMQHCPYMYIGDLVGNVSIFKLDYETCCIEQMKYTIPFSASRGNSSKVSADAAVIQILPQPTAESKRVLIVYRDGPITLWEIQESKPIFTTGGNLPQSQNSEAKKVTSACWVCPFGSKVAVGFNNGEIFIWSVPCTPVSKTEVHSDSLIQASPIYKLNLGYKLDKIPIASLKWLYGDGKASRLYVMGVSDSVSTNLLQIVLLNEQTETRTVKLGLHLSEPCIDMEIITSSSDPSKHKQDCFILLGKSGHVYVYDDHQIEKYLLQSQSRGTPSLPKEVMMKMPFAESSISVAKFITDKPHMLSFGDEDYLQLSKNIPSLFPFDAKAKDGTHANPVPFIGFSKIKNLYITGHCDGSINFWDASCPIFVPIFSLKQQSEDDHSLSGVPLTALYFDGSSRLLISGDQSGTVRIFNFKPEPYGIENSFISFQGSSKRANNHIIQSVKLIKVNGSVLSMNVSHNTGHLAVGTDQGHVSLFDLKGPTLLYQQHIASEISTGIISLQFETCNLHGFDKNVLVVATKDSSVLAIDFDTGNMLSTSTVHPNKPSKALFMQILDGKEMVGGSHLPNGLDSSKGNHAEHSVKQPTVLICSEKAVYVYSLEHVIQGVKKVYYKKKFHSSSCCWASIFCGSSNVGLALLFTNGKIEIRSLPELSSIRESTLRGFTFSAPKLNSISENSICCSRDGELVMVNGDQEMLIMSVLLQKEHFRLLDSVSQVYSKDLIVSQEGLASGTMVQKEKKKGIFSSVMKDITGTKLKQVPELEIEDIKESIKELSVIFATANFTCDTEDSSNKTAVNVDENDLDIDDIDLGDAEEKPKDHNILAALNKQKLASKFQAFTGKIKQMTVKNEKNINREEPHDEKTGAVDQIKKKYGFSTSTESSAAKMAESKLQDNVKKLQGINLRATEMQDTAKSFSAMARELLRTTEEGNKGSS